VVPPEVIAVHQRDRDLMLTGNKEFGRLDFDAWTRRIDKIDPSWRN